MTVLKIRRRDLLVAGGAGALAGAAGLVLGVWYGQRESRRELPAPKASQPFSPNVFLAIDTDETVTIWVTKSEMGQGVYTSLAMIVADELGADWSKVVVRKPVAHPVFGKQSTVTSGSVRRSWDPLRTAAASARAMLERAAAAIWDVSPDGCRARAGAVEHSATGRRLSFGVLAEPAATYEVPATPRLRDPSEYMLIGRPIPRVDIPAKCDGTARFGLDTRRPGQWVAVIARPPRFGARLEGVGDAGARAVAGVREVVKMSDGVAVLGDTTWAALQGRRALELSWSAGHDDFETREVPARLAAGLDGPARPALERGTGAADLRPGDGVLEAVYTVPYLAHAPMEPPNCTAHVEGDACDIWAATQAPLGLRDRVARRFGFDPGRVRVHTTYLGGGFGRRVAHAEAMEAVALSREVGRPVKVTWTREDDIRHDYFRPPMLHRMRAGVGDDGRPVRWQHRVVGPSIMGKDSAEELDQLAVDGAAQLAYGIDHVHVSWTGVELPPPLGFWRSVGHSHCAFAVESFLDELAAAAGQDPLAYRLGLLENAPRHRRVLERAADAADWGRAPDGRVQGIAVHECFGTVVAQVAEVERLDRGAAGSEAAIGLRRVVCAVDCGRVINPDTLRAQVEGGVIYGLTATLRGAISVEGGRVVEGNFDRYPLLRMGEEPRVDVRVVKSDDPPGGAGEVGVPAIAPALANALFAATGERVRDLPLGWRVVSRR